MCVRGGYLVQMCVASGVHVHGSVVYNQGYIPDVHGWFNPLPFRYAFLRICTTFKNHEIVKAFRWLINFRMDLLHAKYTDE